jgi:catechol 2,3-dioxygenase-like lactoylglutathione lyase family enzyme
MIHEFNHYGIVVRDLTASLDFYTNLFSARVVYEGHIPSSDTAVRYLQIAGGMIELLHPAQPRPDETFGITHLAFLTDDLEGDYARLTRKGYLGLVQPKPAGSGVGRLAFLSDPNGARVELIQRDLKMRDGVIDHPVIRAFDHYSLTANDLDGAMRFYRDDLGMKVLKRMEVPARRQTIVYLNWDYDVLELLHRPVPNTTDSMYGHFALRVDDVDAAQRWFADRGVPAEPGMPKAAGTGIGRIGMVRDPDGVKIELVDRPDLRAVPSAQPVDATD